MVGILFALIFTAIPGYVTVTNLWLKRHGHRTTGIVAAIEQDWDSDPDSGGYTYWPVLEFQTDRGFQVTTRSRTSGRPAIGKQVPVLYDPDKPHTAEIDTIWGRGTLAAGAFTLIGVCLLVLAVISYVRH